jgi:ParB family transcriptional regulator, chromosome partitioning protein
MTDLSQGRVDAIRIAIESIHPGKNPRKDFDSVPDLAVSMFGFGQLYPIKVRYDSDGNNVILCDGERRWRAAKYVNDHYDEWMKDNPEKYNRFDTLLCVPEPRGVTPEERLLQQIEVNDTVQPLKAIERAGAYKTLVEAGWTLLAIGKRVGKSAQHVADYISMLEAPKELQEAVERGESSATAVQRAVKASPEKRQEAVDKAQRHEKIKVKDTAEYVPLTPKQFTSTIKKADGILQAATGKEEKARWEGVIRGLRYGAGYQPIDF